MPRRCTQQQIFKKASEKPLNFSNALMKSPLRYTLMERRFLYKLTEAVRNRYKVMGLGVRQNWDNLTFRMTNKDLADIGSRSGAKHINQTYDIVKQLADRSIIQYHFNDKGEFIIGHFHWISAFEWNTETNDYTVTVSPQLFDYVCNLTSRFTRFDIGTGLLLTTKYSQKFFEICSMYTSDKDKPYRHFDYSHPDKYFKQNILKISITDFRTIFGLTELRDLKTGKVIEKEKLVRFRAMENKVIIPSRDELYKLYKLGLSDVWFDYTVERSGRGRGGSPKFLYIFFYTKEMPKSTDLEFDRPHKDGETLNLYEDKKPESSKGASKNKERRIRKDEGKSKTVSLNPDYIQGDLFGNDPKMLRSFIYTYLRSYLNVEEQSYYMAKIDEEQLKNKDSYIQVYRELKAKSLQDKFANSRTSYKRKNIIEFVFKENMKNYGWSIPPMKENNK